ncbi:MAG: crossover junction endodeoxyribonuclease RuvC [Planctomycetota bacterium]
MVRILGIDPGTQIVGFGCLEIAVGEVRVRGDNVPIALRASNVVRASSTVTGGVRLLVAGALRLGKRTTGLPSRLQVLAEQFRALIAQWAPHEVAVEQAFHGKSVQAALRIGEARGVVLAEAAAAGLAVHQFAPARIKRCVTGNGAASKVVVAAMVKRLLGDLGVLGVSPRADTTDAVAAAWTRLEERRSPLVAARARTLDL